MQYNIKIVQYTESASFLCTDVNKRTKIGNFKKKINPAKRRL